MSNDNQDENKTEGEAPEINSVSDAVPITEEAIQEEQSAEDELTLLKTQIAELQDQHLRMRAEFENSRKRMSKEKQEAIDFANQSLILDIIPIIDDFERAIKSSETSKDFASFHEGISMIEKRLLSQLESKWGLKRFDSEGKPFDFNFHEAINTEKSADVSEPQVAEDYVKGYTLKDRVIRTAKVKVLMPNEAN